MIKMYNNVKIYVNFWVAELMLLGFISLLLTVSQGPISNMCISLHLASIMLPCKLPHESSSAPATEHFHLHHTYNNGRRRLLSEGSESQYCAHKVCIIYDTLINFY